MSLIRASSTIASLTMVSRVFGFVRDMMIASFLGAGMGADAFFVAFKLPNFMRRLFAEGAFNSAFLPLYAGTLAHEGEVKAKQLAEEIQTMLVLVLIVFTALAMIFMPQLMSILAYGFDKDPEKFKLAVTLTRITFPYLFCIALVSLQGGLLNSIDKFAAVAAAPIVMNVCLISSLAVLAQFIPAPYAAATGVLISGIAQYWWLHYFCKKAGIAPRLILPKMTDNVRKLFALIGPAALGSSTVQINLLVDTFIASLIPGAVSFLYYADRISELPFGVIGVAVSTAMLPMLSRQIRTGQIAEAMHTQNRSVELSMLLALPATIALIIIPYPVITVIYEHGAFSALDTEATFKTLIAYSIGTPAFMLGKVFVSTFYANQDTKTPMKIGIVCVLINLCCNLILMHPLQYVGLALSTTIAGWVNCTSLFIQLRKRNLFIIDSLFTFRMKRIVASTAIMAVVLVIANYLLAEYFHEAFIVKVIALFALVAIGGSTYAASLFFLGLLKPAEIRAYFKKRPA